MAEEQPAAKRPRPDVEASKSNDEARWTEVFWMLHDGGQGDRGPHYALTIANLKKRADDIDAQVEALRQAECDLLKSACAEVLGQASARAAQRSAEELEQALTWGRALARAVEVQSSEAARLALADEPLDAPTQLSIEAQKCAQAAQAEQTESRQRAEAERQAQQAAQAEQLLAQQAAAMQQAQAMSNQPAQAMAQALQRAQAMANQAALAKQGQSEAWGAGGAGQAFAGGAVGQAAGWNHPETLLNTRGYPMRPGQTPCAFYLRTGICKYVGTCKYDHPEMTNAPGV